MYPARMTKLLLVLAACGSSAMNQPASDATHSDGSSSGSGGGDGGMDINQSGSRIKQKVLMTPDGAKVFQNSYDTQLNIDCTFRLAADGQLRCLPYLNVAYDFGSYFADSNCTVPVALYYASCGAPSYIIAQLSSTCPTNPSSRVFSTGSLVTSFYTKGGTTCSGPSTSPAYQFYTEGAEQPATSFQSATASVQ